MLGNTQLAAVNASGAPTVIATTDADNRWQDAATPPAGHTLATAENIVYVLETNRALDRDRVLMFTSP